MNIFIDSGILIHLFDIKDRCGTITNHKIVKTIYENLIFDNHELFTTNYIIAETFNRILQITNKNDYTLENVYNFWKATIYNLNIISIEDRYFKEAMDLIVSNDFRYLKYSFVDALSLSFIRNEDNFYNKEYKVFTIDTSWNNYWWYKNKELRAINIIEIF